MKSYRSHWGFLGSIFLANSDNNFRRIFFSGFILLFPKSLVGFLFIACACQVIANIFVSEKLILSNVIVISFFALLSEKQKNQSVWCYRSFSECTRCNQGIFPRLWYLKRKN